MNEEELKATIGEAAFNAMSAEQRTAIIRKFSSQKPATPANNEIEEIKKTLATLVAAKKEDNSDPVLDRVSKEKKAKEDARSVQDKIATAVRFNTGLDTFLKEYAGVLPADCNEIPGAASAKDYPDEVERTKAIKAALITSFFKEEKNEKVLSDSQRARLKAWQSLGKDARTEDAPNVYDSIFEPAVNSARVLRQAELLKGGNAQAGSSDSEIIMRKVHAKALRNILGQHKLNDVLHDQAVALGLVKEG